MKVQCNWRGLGEVVEKRICFLGPGPAVKTELLEMAARCGPVGYPVHVGSIHVDLRGRDLGRVVDVDSDGGHCQIRHPLSSGEPSSCYQASECTVARPRMPPIGTGSCSVGNLE